MEWRRLDDTTQITTTEVQRAQAEVTLPQPEQLLHPRNINDLGIDIVEEIRVKGNIDNNFEEDVNLGPDENSENSIIDKLVKIIAKIPVNLTMEELFQITPHCKEALMRKLEGVSKLTLPRVPMHNAEKTAILDKGVVVQLSVRLRIFQDSI